MGGVTKSIGKVFKGALGAVGLGGKAPKIDMPEQKVAAQQVDAPVTKAEVDETSDTESKRKQTQRSGKGSLSVAKSGGKGLNV